jgi:hypothetical protein
MPFSITLSPQVKFADRLGIIGITRRRGTPFFTKLEQPHARKTPFKKTEKIHALKSTF